jgi:NADPH2:quinone reductase
MQAVLLKQTGSSHVLVSEKLAKPVPRDGELLIRVHSIGINYSDILIREGRYPYMPDLPAILGTECSGYVERLGSNVKGFTAGQPVLVFGKPSYASHITAGKRQVYPLPEGVDLAKAAALAVTYLTAYHLLHTVRRARAGEVALVYAAAGGVGTALLQLAKLAGVKVIGLCGSDEKVEWLQKNGCWKAINYQEENVLKAVLDATHGLGVDMVFDSVAGKGFRDNFRMLKNLGHVVWFGMSDGLPKLNILKTLARNPAQSSAISIFHLFSIMQNAPLLKQSMLELIQLLAEGKINPVIDSCWPLHKVSAAQKLLESRQTIGKVLLQP